MLYDNYVDSAEENLWDASCLPLGERNKTFKNRKSRVRKEILEYDDLARFDLFRSTRDFAISEDLIVMVSSTNRADYSLIVSALSAAFWFGCGLLGAISIVMFAAKEITGNHFYFAPALVSFFLFITLISLSRQLLGRSIRSARRKESRFAHVGS